VWTISPVLRCRTAQGYYLDEATASLFKLTAMDSQPAVGQIITMNDAPEKCFGFSRSVFLIFGIFPPHPFA
jgi:hypothetical protein